MSPPSTLSRITNWFSFRNLITRAVLVPVALTLLGAGIYAIEYTFYNACDHFIDPLGPTSVCFAPDPAYYNFGIAAVTGAVALSVLIFYSSLRRRGP